MAHINDCIPGARAKVQRSGVARVNQRMGTIVEVSRVKRAPTDPLRETVTVDVPGHGLIVVTPADIEIVAE